jgi:hypothetical protein
MPQIHMAGKSVEHHASNFSRTLEAAAKFPGVKINRESYLRAALSRHCADAQVDQAIATTPAKAGVSLEVIKKAANDAIAYETSKVTALSAAAGIPGILWLPATLSGDAVQYIAHVLRISQKLAYLYSWPNLFSQNKEKLDDGTESVLILFIGVMVGVQGATSALEKFSVVIAARIATELPKQALTKGAIYPAVKSVAGALGVKLTTRTFASGVSKIVPVLGAITSGGITLASYWTMSKRLQKHLASLQLTKPDFAESSSTEIIIDAELGDAELSETVGDEVSQ